MDKSPTIALQTIEDEDPYLAQAIMRINIWLKDKKHGNTYVFAKGDYDEHSIPHVKAGFSSIGYNTLRAKNDPRNISQFTGENIYIPYIWAHCEPNSIYKLDTREVKCKLIPYLPDNSLWCELQFLKGATNWTIKIGDTIYKLEQAIDASGNPISGWYTQTNTADPTKMMYVTRIGAKKARQGIIEQEMKEMLDKYPQCAGLVNPFMTLIPNLDMSSHYDKALINGDYMSDNYKALLEQEATMQEHYGFTVDQWKELANIVAKHANLEYAPDTFLIKTQK